ncbi:hypothetical protein KE531_16415 [Eubacteriaceae bacterium Marseille-Q4139]|nr:hypothetical protein [Eubacteriaceae bacterium Marseille-Q4139]
MRKKYLAITLLASALAVQSIVPALASSSSSSDDNEPAYDVTVYDPNASTTVTVGENGVKTTGVGTSTSANGSSIAVVVETTTPSGTPITVNENGEAVIGNKIVGFAGGSAATAGLPTAVVDTINAINSGRTLSEVVTGVDVSGYNALTGTHAVVTKNAATGAVEDTATEVVLYVPNLVDGLGNVSILYYNNATGTWMVIPATQIDPVTKLVYATVPGSGTLSVVYKN